MHDLSSYNTYYKENIKKKSTIGNAYYRLQLDKHKHIC